MFEEMPSLSSIVFAEVSMLDLNSPVLLTVSDLISEADQIPDHSVTLDFQNSDAEELKNLSFTITGEQATYMIGEAETNHF